MNQKLIIAGVGVLLGAVLAFKNSPSHSSSSIESEAIPVHTSSSSVAHQKASRMVTKTAPVKNQMTKQIETVEASQSTPNSEACQLRGSKLSAEQRAKCLESNRVFHLTKSVLASKPQQWDQLDDRSLKTAMKTFLSHYTDSQAEKFDELVKYMSKRLPNDGMVAKAALIPLTANTRAEVIDHVRQNFEKASRLNPNDPEILGAEMFLALTTGEKNVLQHLEEFNRANPDSGLGLVYAASIYHLQGRTDLARSAIQEARKDSTRNVRIMVKLVEDAFRGDSNEVPVMVNLGVPTNIRVADLPKWVPVR